jgi:hypothetical protein
MLQRALASLRRALSSLRTVSFHRRAAPRAAVTLAVAGLLLTMMSPAASAHSLHGYTLDFFKLHAVKESGELGSDEPYVVMAVVNLVTRELAVTRTSVFSDVDTGESRSQTVRLWGPAGTAAPLPANNPDNLIILVMAMEHDDCDVNSVAFRIESEMRSRLGTLGGAARAEIVAGLQDAMFLVGSVACLNIWPWQTSDDWVGHPQEVRISAADVATAHSGTTVEKVLEHDGSNTHYRTFFRFQAAPSTVVGTTSGILVP